MVSDGEMSLLHLIDGYKMKKAKRVSTIIFKINSEDMEKRKKESKTNVIYSRIFTDFFFGVVLGDVNSFDMTVVMRILI